MSFASRLFPILISPFFLTACLSDGGGGLAGTLPEIGNPPAPRNYVLDPEEIIEAPDQRAVADIGQADVVYSYFEDANLTNSNTWGFIGGYENGIATNGWSNFVSDIQDAWTDGYDGTNMRIAVVDTVHLENPYAQDDMINYRIGEYDGFGGHGERMQRMAGGVYIDDDGDVAVGIARGAEVDLFDTGAASAIQNGNYDFVSMSLSTQSPTTLSRVETMIEETEAVFLTSLGNYAKFNQANCLSELWNAQFGTCTTPDETPQHMIDAGYADQLVLVTGMVAGNAPRNEAQAQRTITAPYIYAGINGTSHATAGVAGMLAIIKQKGGAGFSSSDAANAMLETADRDFDNYELMHYGRGRVNLQRALSPVGMVR